MTEPIAVGMSGGVDSSVVASVLKEQGYRVIGVTMHLWDGDGADSCGSASASRDAKGICDSLGIEHYVLDLRQEFSRYVIDYFTDEYINGRTPNPCIACNKFLKFDAMAKAGEELNAKYVATGHYARIEKQDNRYLLKKARAIAKDQTYVLYNLTQERLARTLLPLGEFENKDAVRAYAEAMGMDTASKPDSQEICFVPDKDYASFIKNRIGSLPEEGDFADLAGNILGRHKGIVNYTIGQRKGLGIAFGKPMFVVRIDAEKNQVILGEQGAEFSHRLTAVNPNYIAFDKPTEPFRAEVKVRYSAPPALGTVYPEENGFSIEFDTAQRAITPGQAVVLYDGDVVLGGATII